MDCFRYILNRFIGDQIKFWVKGRDNLGNTKTASTVVTADFSPPIVSSMDDNTTTYMVLNVPEGPFNYTSRWVYVFNFHIVS